MNHLGFQFFKDLISNLDFTAEEKKKVKQAFLIIRKKVVKNKLKKRRGKKAGFLSL